MAASHVQEQLASLGFQPVSVQTGADWRISRPQGEAFGLQPTEIVARFEQDRLREITIFFYTRGDQGTLSEAHFRENVTHVCARASQWGGTRGQPRRQESRPAHRYVAGMTWVQGELQLDVEWAWSKGEDGGFQSEYLKATLQPYNPSKKAMILSGHNRMDSETTGIRLMTLPEMRKRVQRRSNGDVVISDVPMVDQGEKGYCAVATVERLLRFYGLAVDQHALAQWAGSDAERGTEPQALMGALRRMASQTRLRVVALRDSEAMSDWREGNRIVRMPKTLLDLLRDYNRLARREKLPEIAAGDLLKSGSVVKVYRMMNAHLLREAKLSDQTGRHRFMTDVQRFIDSGVPLVWGVTVGLVPERDIAFSGAQRRARSANRREQILEGHLRLIIGYNSTSGEILYSDTWGAGHEEKRLSPEDAWVITEGLHAVIPSHIRL